MANEGQLVIIAGRPGHSKTAFSCQIAINVAKKHRVLYFSLEMKKEALRKRLLAVESEVPIKKLNNPIFADKLKKAVDRQSSYKLDIIDDVGLVINDILTKCYDEHNIEPLAMVVVDYLGIIKVNNEFRATAIGEIAKRLKTDLADKLKIPVIALAQMNRAFDTRQVQAKEDEEVRPTLADIGESSGIEHAADVVMFVHRPYLTNPQADPSKFKVFVAKNRNGEVRDFELDYVQELTKFLDHTTY